MGNINIRISDELHAIIARISEIERKPLTKLIPEIIEDGIELSHRRKMLVRDMEEFVTREKEREKKKGVDH